MNSTDSKMFHCLNASTKNYLFLPFLPFGREDFLSALSIRCSLFLQSFSCSTGGKINCCIYILF